MKRDYGVYLEDIVEAIRRIEEYSKGLSFEDFSENNQIVDAIVRNFEIIGEAAKKVGQEIKRKNPTIPWKAMTGMRDKLVHEYFGVNKKVIWKTIKNDLPPVKPRIQKILNGLNRQMRLRK